MDQLPAKPNPANPTNQGRIIAEAHFSSAAYAGPIPPPSVLEQYEAAIPGLGHKIVEWADRQAIHRQELEKTVIGGDSARAWWGLAAGFVIAMSCVIGGVWLIQLGHDAAGVSIATVPVVSLAGVFVYGTASRRAEREQKAEEVKNKKK